MNEVSVILRDRVKIPVEEFRILNYSSYGRTWILIHRPSLTEPILSKQRTVEYIFDIESFTIFKLVSQNVLAAWETDITKYIKPYEEFHLKGSLFIQPYIDCDRNL